MKMKNHCFFREVLREEEVGRRNVNELIFCNM